MSNPYLDRKARRVIGATGRKSETKAASRLGFKTTPASGAATAKGDMRSDDFLIEAKATEGASLGLRHDWLCKITDEATMVGREPALHVSFVDVHGKPARCGAWVLVREDTFRRIVQSIANEVADGG